MGLQDFHLPLNRLDTKNQPPIHFLQVQDVLTLYFVIAWTIAYILYIRKAWKDKSYGVPLVTLWLNVGWEIVFGLILTEKTEHGPIAAPWALSDFLLVWATMKFGPAEWAHKPLVSYNLWWMVPAGLVIASGFYWTLLESFPLVQDGLLITILINQSFTSLGAILHLIGKGNTRGHSLWIWFWRMTGTSLAIVCLYWQWYFYPEDHTFMMLPLTTFTIATFELADLIYPFVYLHISRQEALQQAAKAPRGSSKTK